MMISTIFVDYFKSAFKYGLVIALLLCCAFSSPTDAQTPPAPTPVPSTAATVVANYDQQHLNICTIFNNPSGCGAGVTFKSELNNEFCGIWQEYWSNDGNTLARCTIIKYADLDGTTCGFERDMVGGKIRYIGWLGAYMYKSDSSVCAQDSVYVNAYFETTTVAGTVAHVLVDGVSVHTAYKSHVKLCADDQCLVEKTGIRELKEIFVEVSLFDGINHIVTPTAFFFSSEPDPAAPVGTATVVPQSAVSIVKVTGGRTVAKLVPECRLDCRHLSWLHIVSDVNPQTMSSVRLLGSDSGNTVSSLPVSVTDDKTTPTPIPPIPTPVPDITDSGWITVLASSVAGVGAVAGGVLMVVKRRKRKAEQFAATAV